MLASSCLPSGCFPQPRWAVVGALSVAVPQELCPGQGHWHRTLAQHSRGCCWSGKCSSSTSPCPWIHRDPPSRLKSSSHHGQPHAWHGVPIMLGSCVSSAPGGSQSPWLVPLNASRSCQQPFPMGTVLSPHHSWLAPTWRHSSTISPPADQGFLKFIRLFV